METKSDTGVAIAPHSSSLQVTRDVLIRYDRPGPRYTSYPTAPEWRDDFGDAEYRRALMAAAGQDEALSLYVHLPFCRSKCAYCGCNSLVADHEGAIGEYIGYVERELALLADCLEGRRRLAQLHWGGGTPTYLTVGQLQRLFRSIQTHFEFVPDAEIALEVDPRITTLEQIRGLRALGFNRISMGVQDFDLTVQEAIGRRQTEADTQRLYAWCRSAGFRGVNMDLVYGLPGQTPARWSETLKKIIEMLPDRLAVYSFAYLPDRLPNQQLLGRAHIPTGQEKYELFAMARQAFVEAGYHTIGMDHFALPQDELSIAMDARRLNRNFMGYTAVLASDMAACGVSAISEIGGCYAQNEKTLSAYYEALNEGRFPVAVGLALTEDDIIRRWVIRQLMCNFHLDFSELRRRFSVHFREYFSEALSALCQFEDDGFVTLKEDALEVLPLGQVFVRNIAMVFDAYLRSGQTRGQFSRTI